MKTRTLTVVLHQEDNLYVASVGCVSDSVTHHFQKSSKNMRKEKVRYGTAPYQIGNPSPTFEKRPREVLKTWQVWFLNQN